MSKMSCFALAVVLFVFMSIDQPKRGLAKDQDPDVEKVVTGHINSIGDPAALAGIKSRAFLGTSSVEFVQGMRGNMNGQSMLVSEGQKLAIVMKYGDINYPGEYFAYDGKDVTVGYMSPGQRSPLADFLFRNNGLMKEGLLGGVLSGTWPLLNLQQSQAALKHRETTIEGRKLHEIEYTPKSRLGDVKIKMYFEPETFHHVRTEYRVRHKDDMSAGHGADPAGGRFILREGVADSIYVLVETFDDFKKAGEMTLPHTYTIDYSFEGQGPSFVGKWVLKANQWSFTNTYDERIFKAQK